MVKRTRIFLLPDAENSFCFGECFGAEVDETDDPYIFSAGDTLSPDTKEYDYFYTTYYPNGQNGKSIIKYTFYDNDTTSIATSVIFIFDSGDARIGNISEMAQLNIYPNPTTGELRIKNYELREDAEYVIYSVVGQVVMQGILSCRDAACHVPTTINVESLSAGMYFLRIDGKTVRFVKE